MTIAIPEPGSLHIAIVGAGIGGLAAACGLLDGGHSVTVFEQSRLADEIGAALHITPNAFGILYHLGIDPKKSNPVDYRGHRFHLPDGKLRMKRKPEVFDSLPYSRSWVLAHRAHLHALIKNAALERGATLKTGQKVATVQPETNTVVLENGDTFMADVIIGADGVHSKAREGLFGTQIQPFNTGKSAFRFLLEKDIILADESVPRDLFKDGQICFWGAKDRRLLMYPTSGGNLLNFVCIHPGHLSAVSSDAGYNTEGNYDKLLEVYGDFDSVIVNIVKKVGKHSIKIWPLLDMETLPTYVKGNVALIGDAAHPFLPYAYQGAGLALEDAASIATVLAGPISKADIPARLKLYEKCRYERDNVIQEFSRQMGQDHSDDPNFNPEPMFKMAYIHDEFKHSETMLKDFLQGKVSV